MKAKMRILSIVITIAMLVGMLPMYSLAAYEYPVITVGTPVTVTLDGESVTEMIYKFVPEKDGKYTVFSNENNHDTYGYLLDSNMEEINHDDDSYGEGNNFRIVWDAVAGTTYYLKGRFYSTTNIGSFNMTVNEAVSPTDVTIIDEYDKAIDSIDIYEGDCIYLKSVLQPSNAYTSNIIWSSDSDSMVVNSYGGNVYAVKPGTANITVKVDNNVSTSVTVNVKAATEITSDSVTTVTHDGGFDGVPMFKFTPEETATYSIYTSSEETLGLDLWFSWIDENGTLGFEYSLDYYIENNNRRLDYEFEAGKTYFICVGHNLTDEHSFKLHLIKLVPATGMGLTPDVHSGVYDTTVQLEPYFLPELSAAPESVTYVSSANDIVSVDADGLATLHKIGEATVTATSENGLTAECKITVTDIPTITSGETVDVNIATPGYHAIFKFTPETDGLYTFASEGGLDTYGYILDADRNELASHDGSTDFFCTYEMTAGTPYLLKARMYSSSNTGSFTVSVTKHECSINYEYDTITHSYYCDDCGNSVSEEHTFIDGVCICGYFEHEHVLWNYSSNDEVCHSAECAKCLMYFTYDHTLGDDGKCICGFYEHEHDYVISDNYNDTSHETRCKVCSDFKVVTHEFDADGKCECGYIYHTHSGNSFYKYESYHLGYCSICKIYFDYSEHSYNEDGICTCGAMDHNHENIDYVNTHLEYHDEICEDCGVLISSVLHSYNESGICICGQDNNYVSDGFINIGDDIVLYDGQYLAEDGTITSEEPEKWAAHFADMVLTLNDIDIRSNTSGIFCCYAEESLEIVVNGNVSITSYEDGIHLDEGNLSISGTGILNITVLEDYDGIDAVQDGHMYIDGDVTIIISAGDNGIETEDNFYMNSGTLVINAGDEGIDSSDNAEINGGTIIINSHNDCIDTDDNLTINGGYFFLAAGSNAFEVDDNLIINGGIIRASSVYAAITIRGTLTIAEEMGTVEMVYIEESGYYHSSNGDEDMTELMLPVKTDIGFTATLSADSAYYNGNDLTPTVTVKDADGNTLTENTHYTIEWSKDKIIDSGIYIATVTGMGEFEDFVTYSIFSIKDTFVYVAGVEMHNGDYLANGSDTVTKEKPEGGYAYFNNGVLELNNFEYEGEGYMYEKDDYYTGVIYSIFDLEIVLKGKNSITNTSRYSQSIVSSNNITINGNGTLVLNSNYGIYLYEGIITINSGTVIINGSDWGIYTYEIAVNGGNLKVNSVFGIFGYAVKLNGGTVDIKSVEAIVVYGSIEINGGVTNIEADTGIYCYMIFVEDGFVKINATRRSIEVENVQDDCGIYLGEDMAIRDPEDTTIKLVKEYYNIFDSDEILATRIVIAGSNYGDANADGEVNLSDASHMMKYIAGWDVMLDEYCSDTNNDSNVTLSDVSLLMKYIAGWNVKLGR